MPSWHVASPAARPRKLEPLEITECPFVNLPEARSSRWGGGVTAEQMSEMHWTRPKVVAQIRFVEWTAEGRLRHAAFLGLREDKTAKETLMQGELMRMRAQGRQVATDR